MALTAASPAHRNSADSAEPVASTSAPKAKPVSTLPTFATAVINPVDSEAMDGRTSSLGSVQNVPQHSDTEAYAPINTAVTSACGTKGTAASVTTGGGNGGRGGAKMFGIG